MLAERNSENRFNMAIKSKLIGGGVIDGVDLKTCTMHTDSRGVFTEVFQDAWGTVIDPCQWSVVSSEANVFRGCHIHISCGDSPWLVFSSGFNASAGGIRKLS